MPRSRSLFTAAVVTVLILGACSRGGDDKQSTSTDGATEPYNSGAVGDAFGTGSGAGGAVARRVAEPPPAPMVANATRALRETEVASRDQALDPGSLPIDAAAPMIVRTGSATIKVDSLVPAIARIRVMARQLGGYVGATSIQVGSEQVRSASIEIKVPAARWNELLEGMKPVGVLEHQEESAQDVGEEFVDVSARIANAKRLEARLLDLLASRTGKLSDALEVEQSIAQVREEIERYQGRLRYLGARSSMSTMTVALHEPPPLVGSHPGENPIADAARTAWHLFVSLVAFLVASLGVVIPLALLIALLWWIRRSWGRRPAPSL